MNDSVVAAHQKKQEQGNSLFAAALKAMLSKSLGATGEEISNDIDEIEKIGEDNKASAEGHEGKTKPEHMTPQELHQSLWKILSLRDKSESTRSTTKYPPAECRVQLSSQSIEQSVG